MELRKPVDLFSLSAGDLVTKRNLFDLIQYSKVQASSYWAGADLQIGNTPQQGINWLGPPPACYAVIIKTRPGSYEEDGWVNKERTAYKYSFKARSGDISYTEKANAVLIGQQQYLYPILLFTEDRASWLFEGAFSVVEIQDKYVVLDRVAHLVATPASMQDEPIFQEGGRKYVAHLMAERNKKVVKAIKEGSTWTCDICRMKFVERYGLDYIEAHHKVPISTYSSTYQVRVQDFSLLCPNCHRAVHMYMRAEGLEYTQIKERLRGRLSSSALRGDD
ncbi:MAG: HNH endonuclease [Rhodanobacter sp.]